MTVQELIDELMKIENKNLPVCVYADHGQSSQDASGVSLAVIEDPSEYMMDSLHPDDWEGREPNYVEIS